jgi:dTDP-4-dehydrorhamnose reductase
MKIIITGATGFLGREVILSALRRGHNIIAIGHAQKPNLPGIAQSLQFDLSNSQNIENLLLNEFPDAIINCAGIATIEGCDAEPELAEKLNVALPRSLAMMANHLSGRFIHVSTDMVFDGDKGNYEHTDKPFPLHLYGQTKLMGEKETLKYGKNHAVVIRTSVLSGNTLSGNKSLHERLFDQWAAGKTTSLFTDEIRQPVSASNLADVLVELCERDNLSGVYHWSGNEALSRYDIGRRIAEHFGLDPEKVIKPTTYEEAAVPVRRPRNLSFILHPLQGKLKTQVQNFDEMLSEMRVPPQHTAWHSSATGRTTVRRLVKGVDF